MRRSSVGVLALATVAILALPTLGQIGRSRTSTVTMGNSLRAARLPYMAEYKTTQVRTLADGTAITLDSTEVIAVDAQGRQMIATTMIPLSEDQTARTRFAVFDPVSHTNIRWVSPGQKATVAAIPIAGAWLFGCGAATVTVGPLHPDATGEASRVKRTTEDLGTETIQGLEARGRRTTTAISSGAIGNNKPLVHTIELWTAVTPGLHGLAVREVRDDPQTGRTSKKMVSFSQGEPDASVFMPPAGYEIVNREVSANLCASTEGTEQPMTPLP